LIVLINKADQVKKKDELLEAIEKISSKYFCGAPVIFISAKNGFNCEHVLKEVIKLHEKWNKRIKTSKLNNWLHDALVEHEHRLAKANRKAVKIKFMSQYDIRPPHFYVNINKLKALDQTYKRYLINSLRKNFGFDGVPIRVEFRESKNPYIENNPHYKNYNKPKK
jgi:GTP-binding protein